MKHFAKYSPSNAVTFSEATTIWNDKEINKPDYSKIGLYNADDMNTGGFLWFEDDDDLQFFLKNVWPVLLQGEDMPNELITQWESYANDFLSHKSTNKDMLNFVNENWEGDIAIDWIGSLEELEKSSDETCAIVREWFHETEEPISEKEKKEFLEFIKQGFC